MARVADTRTRCASTRGFTRSCGSSTPPPSPTDSTPRPSTISSAPSRPSSDPAPSTRSVPYSSDHEPVRENVAGPGGVGRGPEADAGPAGQGAALPLLPPRLQVPRLPRQTRARPRPQRRPPPPFALPPHQPPFSTCPLPVSEGPEPGQEEAGGEAVFSCSVCGQDFRSRAILARHEATHAAPAKPPTAFDVGAPFTSQSPRTWPHSPGSSRWKRREPVPIAPAGSSTRRASSSTSSTTSPRGISL